MSRIWMPGGGGGGADLDLVTAQAGDVLAGIIGGLLAQGAGVADSAVLGVYVHGLAGEQAAGPNPAGLLAHEIADALGEIPWGRL